MESHGIYHEDIFKKFSSTLHCLHFSYISNIYELNFRTLPKTNCIICHNIPYTLTIGCEKKLHKLIQINVPIGYNYDLYSYIILCRKLFTTFRTPMPF